MNEQQQTQWKLVPIAATTEIVDAIERAIDKQLTASGISPGDMQRQDGDAIYAAAMAAASRPTGVCMLWPDVPGWFWAYGRIAGMREPALMSARALLEDDKLIVYIGEAMTHRLSFPDSELPLQFKPAVFPDF